MVKRLEKERRGNKSGERGGEVRRGERRGNKSGERGGGEERGEVKNARKERKARRVISPEIDHSP